MNYIHLRLHVAQAFQNEKVISPEKPNINGHAEMNTLKYLLSQLGPLAVTLSEAEQWVLLGLAFKEKEELQLR